MAFTQESLILREAKFNFRAIRQTDAYQHVAFGNARIDNIICQMVVMP